MEQVPNTKAFAPPTAEPAADAAGSRPARRRLGVPELIVALPLAVFALIMVAASASGLGSGSSAFLFTLILAVLALAGSLVLSYRNSRSPARQAREPQARMRKRLDGAAIGLAPTGAGEFDSLSDVLAKASQFLAPRTGRQRRGEQELRTREDHIRFLADSMPQLVWTAAPDGRIEYTNARRERYAIIDRTDWEGIIHPDDRPATAEAWRRASEAGVPYEIEHRLFTDGKGYAWHSSRASPLLDAHGAVVRWYGTTADIDDQKQREQRILDLMAEVNHRSRNLLAVAQAIARCDAPNAKTVDEFQQRYSERLRSLAASQDLLTDCNWRGVSIEALARAQAAPVLSGLDTRLASDGPLILLNPNATQTLGLALHELIDNAVKHGALSSDEGGVSLVWRIDESRAEPKFEITWRERGGPPVSGAPIRGFGSLVLERFTAEGLRGSSRLSFKPGGVTWRLTAPRKELVRPQ